MLSPQHIWIVYMTHILLANQFCYQLWLLWWRTCGLGLEVTAGHKDLSSNLCLGYLPRRLVNELRASPGLANIIESYAHVRSGPSFRFATIIRSLIKAKGQKAMSQPIQVNNIIAVNNCDFIKSQCVKRYAKSIVGFTYFNSFWAAAKCNDDFDPDKCDEKLKITYLNIPYNIINKK